MRPWQEERSTLTCVCCCGITFRLSVVSYLIPIAIGFYRLRRATDWAWGSVTHADAPLAYELSATLAFGGRIGKSPTKEVEIGTVRKFVCLAEAILCRNCSVQLHRFNQRLASRIRNSVGSNQEYQSVSGSAITLRLLALIAQSLVTTQSETKPTAGQWL
jgi:hypothetical protein